MATCKLCGVHCLTLVHVMAHECMPNPSKQSVHEEQTLIAIPEHDKHNVMDLDVVSSEDDDNMGDCTLHMLPDLIDAIDLSSSEDDDHKSDAIANRPLDYTVNQLLMTKVNQMQL